MPQTEHCPNVSWSPGERHANPLRMASHKGHPCKHVPAMQSPARERSWRWGCLQDNVGAPQSILSCTFQYTNILCFKNKSIKRMCLSYNVLKNSWAGVEHCLPNLLGGINMKKMHGWVVRRLGVRDIWSWILAQSIPRYRIWANYWTFQNLNF